MMSSVPPLCNHIHNNRLDDRLAAGHPVLTCYFPVGDPRMPTSLLDIYDRCGVDVVELGLPSANPFMDGASVTDAMRRAMARMGAGALITSLEQAAARLRSFSDGPAAICMTYADFDVEALLASRVWDKLDGLLMLGIDDLENRSGIIATLQKHQVRQVKFVDWDLSASFLNAAKASDSYLMLQAAPGSTGARPVLDEKNNDHIRQVRRFDLKQPILLGFGIGTAKQARDAIRLGADGVVIGSMCIEKALEGPKQLEIFLSGVREALDG